MAKLSDLIPALSKATGMPETSVEAYARRIRQAGKLSTGGRGLGAAEMTSQDCANLLIAVMARTPTHAVEELHRFGSMTCGSEEPGDRGMPLYDVFDLKAGHTFSELMTKLVQSAQTSSIEKYIEQAFINSKLIEESINEKYFFTANISIITPWNSASISVDAHHIYGKENSENLWIIYLPRRYWPRVGKSITIGPLGDTSRGDLHQETKISQKTIDALGQLLRDT